MLYIINGLIDKPKFVIEVMRNSICQLWIHHQSVNNQTVTVTIAKTVTHYMLDRSLLDLLQALQ
jgi:hypothetical protein